MRVFATLFLIGVFPIALFGCKYGRTCSGTWERGYGGESVCRSGRNSPDARARYHVRGSHGYYVEDGRPAEAQAELDRRRRRWQIMACGLEQAGALIAGDDEALRQQQCYCDCTAEGGTTFQCRQLCGLYR